ncbi:MAG: zf-HC2 domain-containing protein [Gemmatimonadetes bacterium]|nr:zf-HC2 domain-containing protein [Gemmatimonadota bacterium]
MEFEGSGQHHPTDDEIVSYLGHELEGEALQRLERHLTQCTRCRQEVIDAKEILRTPRRIRWPVLAPVAAAAAVLVLFFSWPQSDGLPTGEPIHREAPTELGVAPIPVSPIGSTVELGALVWTRVPRADRYRLTLFEAEGTVLFRANTVDTLAFLPDSTTLQAGRPYLWRVEARVGWDVWEASDLVEFQLEGGSQLDGTTSPKPRPGGPR